MPVLFDNLDTGVAGDDFPGSAVAMGASIKSPLNETLASKAITQVIFLIKQNGATTGTLKSQIIATDGSVLGTSTNSVDVTTLSGAFSNAAFNFNSVELPATATGIIFSIYFDSGGNGNIQVRLGVLSAVDEVRAYGSASGAGATWTVQTTYEICMQISGDTPSGASGVVIPPPPAMVRL